jgi:hypothetical protein
MNSFLTMVSWLAFEQKQKSSLRRGPLADWLQLGNVGIGDLLDLSLILIPERKGLRPPTQLFKPISHLTPAHFVNITMFTIWVVDSQDRQQGADPTSQVHNPPRQIRVIRLRG